jgi:ABC-type proline/glycine betaine transport system permease subunit
MKKLLAAALALPLVAGQATAGGLAEPIVEQEIEQQTAAGSRAGILVPILALILIGFALSNDNDPLPE